MPDQPDLDAVREATTRLYGTEPAAVEPATRLLDVVPDSLGVVELAMEVEDAIGVTLPDEPLGTVQDLLDAVARARA